MILTSEKAEPLNSEMFDAAFSRVSAKLFCCGGPHQFWPSWRPLVPNMRHVSYGRHPMEWRRPLYFSFVVFIYLFFLACSQPCRMDVCHTSAHGVALVRIQNAGLKCAARCSLKYRTQKIAKNSPPDNFVGLCLRN